MSIRKLLDVPPFSFIMKAMQKRFRKGFLKMPATSSFGRLGMGLGSQIDGRQYMEIGEYVSIGGGSEIVVYGSQTRHPHLVIGNHVFSQRCRITCAGNLTIGNDVAIGPDVFITDLNHGTDPTVEGGYLNQPLMIKDVTIGDGVWLGQRSCVMPGVTIGEHSIIGANSVVTHDIPPYSIAVGSPARVVKIWNMEEKCWERV